MHHVQPSSTQYNPLVRTEQDWSLSTSSLIKLILFIIVTIWLLYVSRDSLRMPGSHGFYRFFAWECIFFLFLLNADKWFIAPFSPMHLVSWLLLIISGYLAIHAVRLLRRHGQPGLDREEEPLYDIERTTRLVTEGIYRYIRHPLYGSLLFLAWGICLKDLTWVTGLLALLITGLLIATARADEVECVAYFGTAYEEYMTRTKRFIPFVY